MGRIGKTEICQKLFHTYKESKDFKIKYIGWVAWNGSLKNTLLGKFPEIAADTADYFGDVKKLLSRCGSKFLLFIDNMNDFTAEDVKELNALPCRTVVTSRSDEIDNFIPVTIKSLPKDECIEIYKGVFKNREKEREFEDEIIREIAEKADYITIVIELLAKTPAYRKQSF